MNKQIYVSFFEGHRKDLTQEEKLKRIGICALLYLQSTKITLEKIEGKNWRFPK